MENASIKLTEYSHGAGCGCKIAPLILDRILKTNISIPLDERLLVGNLSKDDAAVYDMGNGIGIISTTDFFMPIVDDPKDFGRIAATNAISDVYAMGGTPMMAIAIFGWPINKLSADIAQQVIDGGRLACANAGIQLAGGHSIDSPEPIFGLAVTGSVLISDLKQNNTASSGCKLYLTKPLGIGILTTAQKKKLLRDEHKFLARDLMCELNIFGKKISSIKGIEAMTDVTGFGLLGHLTEICEGSGVSALIEYDKIPVLPEALRYLEQGAVPGGTTRNFESYGYKVRFQNKALSKIQEHILCDPQTSGGLLIAVNAESEAELLQKARQEGISLNAFGILTDKNSEILIDVI